MIRLSMFLILILLLLEVPLTRGGYDEQKALSVRQPLPLPALMKITPYSEVNDKLLITFEEGIGEVERDGKIYSGAGIPVTHFLYRSVKEPTDEEDFLNSATVIELSLIHI